MFESAALSESGFNRTAALLRELLQALEREREAAPALDEAALLEAGETVERLLAELQAVFPRTGLTAPQSDVLFGLLEQANSVREHNRRLLEQAARRIEAELEQLYREKRALRAYAEPESAEAYFLYRDC
ncbi:MAG: hypothetical protein AB1767_09135 [Bacillota bacterium]